MFIHFEFLTTNIKEQVVQVMVSSPGEAFNVAWLLDKSKEVVAWKMLSHTPAQFGWGTDGWEKLRKDNLFREQDCVGVPLTTLNRPCLGKQETVKSDIKIVDVDNLEIACDLWNETIKKKIFICKANDQQCIFNGDCANHDSAGDFRSDHGLLPQIYFLDEQRSICKCKISENTHAELEFGEMLSFEQITESLTNNS